MSVPSPQGQIDKTFIYGEKLNVPDYMVHNGKNYRIISNQVGTPQMIVDAETGKVIRTYEFDEFGIPQHPKKRLKYHFKRHLSGHHHEGGKNKVRTDFWDSVRLMLLVP